MERDGRSKHERATFAGLDFSGIDFPSDGVTIKSLRREYPQLFDHGLQPDGKMQPQFFWYQRNSRPAEDVLGDLLFSERLIAASAYAGARGIAKPNEWGDPEDFKEGLVRKYVNLRIASGEHHAVELIRDIERQSRSLVRELPR